ncbi:MAG: hypothetical protein HKO69_03225 [Woeseiaceae bacterium]|nr:hypothetical protein [Woeseiaceae bacterium]
MGGPAGPNQFAAVAAATPVIEATADEIAAHDGLLEKMRKSGACVWDFE